MKNYIPVMFCTYDVMQDYYFFLVQVNEENVTRTC